MPGYRRRHAIDRRRGRGVDGGHGAQLLELLIQRVDLVHHRVIVAQQAGARAEDIATKLALRRREAVERAEGAIEAFGVGVEGAE